MRHLQLNDDCTSVMVNYGTVAIALCGAVRMNLRVNVKRHTHSNWV